MFSGHKTTLKGQGSSGKLRDNIVQYLIRCMKMSQNFSIFLLASFLSFFLVLLLTLPFALHILSSYSKKLVVNYGQSLEIGPSSNIGIVDHFATIFAPRLITLFFSLLRQDVVYIQNRSLYGKIYPSSTICSSRISGDITFDDVTSGTKSTINPDVHCRS